MARIFISSTYEDLKDYRQAVYVALRRLGHQSIAMEDYVATDQTPLERTLQDVANSDFYVGIIGWRYGYVPPGENRSITELELEAAKRASIPCLIFLVDEHAPWPRTYIDDNPKLINQFRTALQTQFLVAYFSSPDELAVQVGAALHQWIASGASETPVAVPTKDASAEPPGPEVFLSYAHEDLNVAKSIAERLGNERWSVFWDREIPVGLTWDDIVEGALDGAKCVVVLWSPASRDSDWVRIEAAEGSDRGILAPAIIKNTKIPLRFRRIQAADLQGWSPQSPDTPGMRSLISAIERYV